MKIAVVQDWFIVNGGAEKVTKEIISIFKDDDVDIFSLLDFLGSEDRQSILQGKQSKVSFIQKLPFSRKRYRSYLPFFPYAIEQFDLSKYDLVISSSYAVAKGVLTGTNQIHICYCHSPMRYAWDLYHQYLDQSGYTKGLKSLIIRRVLHRIRLWDYISAQRVDHFIANSKFIAGRIKKIYGREATVIHPPVDIDKFELQKEKGDFYLVVSRLVPYKRVDLVVEAFANLPDKQLIVIGDGPDFKMIKRKATNNIKTIGHASDEVLINYMQKAKALIVAAEEDFGITVVEAQACGTPVIALGRGGYLETVLEGKTGCFFNDQSVSSLVDCINTFENDGIEYDPVKIRDHSIQFNISRFHNELKEYLSNILAFSNDSAK